MSLGLVLVPGLLLQGEAQLLALPQGPFAQLACLAPLHLPLLLRALLLLPALPVSLLLLSPLPVPLLLLPLLVPPPLPAPPLLLLLLLPVPQLLLLPLLLVLPLLLPLPPALPLPVPRLPRPRLLLPALLPAGGGHRLGSPRALLCPGRSPPRCPLPPRWPQLPAAA